MPFVIGNTSSIRRSTIQENDFEIKPAIIQMIQHSVQFSGLPNDDPNTHIANFLEICGTFKHNGVSNDAIKLRFFPFSLRDKAKGWLNSLPPRYRHYLGQIGSKVSSEILATGKNSQDDKRHHHICPIRHGVPL